MSRSNSRLHAVDFTLQEAAKIIDYAETSDESLNGDFGDFLAEDDKVDITIPYHGFIDYDEKGATHEFGELYNITFEKIPTHIKLGTPKEIMAAIDKLREKGKGVMSVGRWHYDESSPPGHLRRIFDNAFKKYYGKDYETVAA